MLLRKLVVVGLVGIVSFAASIAIAEDASGPNVGLVAVDGVDLADPASAFGGERFQFRVVAGESARFNNLGAVTRADRAEDGDYRRFELALVARATNNLDVGIAQRGGLGLNAEGDIESASRGSELRLGRLTGTRRPSSAPSWFVFAAAEDEALTWRPGARSEFGGAGPSFAVQDRVEIGDRQAGVTYARNGWEASFAYVEREVSARTGSTTVSRDQDFTGFTFTMRH